VSRATTNATQVSPITAPAAALTATARRRDRAGGTGGAGAAVAESGGIRVIVADPARGARTGPAPRVPVL
jgi:hypothetical protein